MLPSFPEPEASAIAHPIAPTTHEEAGLDREVITDLVLKAFQGSAGVSGSELAKRLGLAFSVIEPSIDKLEARHNCEIVAGSTLGGSSFRYRLTDHGFEQARAALERNRYQGVAPVPIAQYRQYMNAFSEVASQPVSPAQVREAFSDLVVTEEVLNELGPAINARHSIFIYGPPGNGKSVMAQTVRKLLSGTVAIPHAIEVAGNIIRFFDPSIHEEVAMPDVDPLTEQRLDRRWVCCRRPMVSVGGELTLDALALAYNPRTGIYRAPVQMLANGGVLVIDDFGRQQCPPRELLNWWMVPLESRVEYMTLQSGEKVEMPFLALVIFSTNIRPAELVDEAFLRRIQYKIYAESPTPENFIRIFERCCEKAHIQFNPKLVDDLLERFYAPRGLPLRACQPRDLIQQALALASYQGQAPQLTAELLEAACASYFIIEDHEAPRVPA